MEKSRLVPANPSEFLNENEKGRGASKKLGPLYGPPVGNNSVPLDNLSLASPVKIIKIIHP
jgi:hypothetical protein